MKVDSMDLCLSVLGLFSGMFFMSWYSLHFALFKMIMRVAERGGCVHETFTRTRLWITSPAKGTGEILKEACLSVFVSRRGKNAGGVSS